MPDFYVDDDTGRVHKVEPYPQEEPAMTSRPAQNINDLKRIITNKILKKQKQIEYIERQIIFSRGELKAYQQQLSELCEEEVTP